MGKVRRTGAGEQWERNFSQWDPRVPLRNDDSIVPGQDPEGFDVTSSSF